MNQDDSKRHIDHLRQSDVQSYLRSNSIVQPWFPAYRSSKTETDDIIWYSALVPIRLVASLVQKGDGWDLHLGDGRPSLWTHRKGNRITKRIYCPCGNEEGIEPLVFYRDFHDIHESFPELAQEFRLYCNLYPDPRKMRLLSFDSNGNESEAARYGKDFFEVRSDLLLRFCTAKKMALAVYVDSRRFTMATLKDLKLDECHTAESGKWFQYQFGIADGDLAFRKDVHSMSCLMGKKYLIPEPIRSQDGRRKRAIYQQFIIGEDARGNAVRNTCDPDKLANFFGKNPGAPNYLTPVFFRAEVLTKYYADAGKYSVEDGYLRCGRMWGLRMDNDHPDYIVVWLGDLGQALCEAERNYWLSFNIPPHGRGISNTAVKRDFMVEATDPGSPDLIFKQEYKQFCEDFREKMGWDFFIPLHSDDEHSLVALRLPADDNQAEFDLQLLGLTKVLVDSLNEKEIVKGLTTIQKDDKGITKLEKYFVEKGLPDYEERIKYLRVLQDLRSKSAAHRKGHSYDELVADLQVADEGQHRVFGAMLMAGVELLKFLRKHLLANVST